MSPDEDREPITVAELRRLMRAPNPDPIVEYQRHLEARLQVAYLDGWREGRRRADKRAWHR